MTIENALSFFTWKGISRSHVRMENKSLSIAPSQGTARVLNAVLKSLIVTVMKVIMEFVKRRS